MYREKSLSFGTRSVIYQLELRHRRRQQLIVKANQLGTHSFIYLLPQKSPQNCRRYGNSTVNSIAYVSAGGVCTVYIVHFVALFMFAVHAQIFEYVSLEKPTKRKMSSESRERENNCGYKCCLPSFGNFATYAYGRTYEHSRVRLHSNNNHVYYYCDIYTYS